MRTCTACHRTLPASVDHFQRRDTRVGLSAECWDCLRARWRRRERPKRPRPQTFRDCEHCGERFGPLDRLKRRFCSKRCAYAHRAMLPRKPRASATPEARRAQRRISYLLKAGRIVKPAACENCGEARPLEGAHYDYAEPERVRWLCVSCHRRWDIAEPKGGTTATGQEAEL